MIITLFILWGSLVSINRVKRDISELRNEVIEWQEQATEAEAEFRGSLTARLDSLEKELNGFREAKRSVDTRPANEPDLPNDQERSNDYTPPQFAHTSIHEDHQFRALSKEVQESLVAKQELFLASLSEGELNELSQRTQQRVDSTIQRTIQTIPEDLRSSVLTELETNMDQIHAQMSPVIIQQMMLERQSANESSSPQTEEHQ